MNIGALFSGGCIGALELPPLLILVSKNLPLQVANTLDDLLLPSIVLGALLGVAVTTAIMGDAKTLTAYSTYGSAWFWASCFGVLWMWPIGHMIALERVLHSE